LEGSSISFHTPHSFRFLPDKPAETTMEMHSHFFNNSQQNAVTTHFQKGAELDYMVRNAMMWKGSIWFDNCNGCAKQYHCDMALYLLLNLAFANKIIVDRMVGAPGHGKGEVDLFNAIDKQLLLAGTASIVLPGVKESCNIMAAEAMQRCEK
jgi:hypothetical protein